MAGDWIKVESVTPDKPELVRMAQILGIDQDAVFGKLFRIWSWADQNVVIPDDKSDAESDGASVTVSVTTAFLDRLTFCPGFANALAAVDWLIINDDSVTLPRFGRHNGKTAKDRALTSKRMARLRGKSDANSDASNVTTASAREEKSKEEKKDQKKDRKNGAIAPLDIPAWLPADVWSDWHNYRNGRKGWTTKARQLSLATLADLYAQGHDPRSVINKSIECGWTGLFALKQANAPPGPRPSQPSKTLTAIQLLEDMKNGQMGTSSNLGRIPEAPLLELGPDSGDGHDPGYGSRVA